MLSEESRLADNVKKQAVASNADDLLLYRDQPAYYRSLPGKMADQLLKLSKAGASENEVYEAHHGYRAMHDGMLIGDLNAGIASFGLGISQIKKIEPVADIMDRLNVQS